MLEASSGLTLTLSIVSHGQAKLVRPLLLDLASLPVRDFEVVLTINIPEDESPFEVDGLSILWIRNARPRGFGANHNAAFAVSRGRSFAVVNPDVRIAELDPGILLGPFADAAVGATAPAIRNSGGALEDSARRFPTWRRLAARVLGKSHAPDYAYDRGPVPVDWVAGMFVVFRREAFAAVRGFDDRRFFMYYEDVDICRRLRQRGWSVVLNPALVVVHDAQRASHRSASHLRWHVTSALRYLTGL